MKTLIESVSAVTEAKAATNCPTCGRSIAGNHYWYKGQRKCKAPDARQDAVVPTAPQHTAGDDNQPQQAAEQKPQQANTEPQPNTTSLTLQQLKWLDFHNVDHFTIGADNSLTVQDSLTLVNVSEDRLPVTFSEVQGNVLVESTNLTSLVGLPTKIIGAFHIHDMSIKIKNFEGCPQEIGSGIKINMPKCKLDNLIGLPTRVSRFQLKIESTASLDGLPKYFGDVVSSRSIMLDFGDTPLPVVATIHEYVERAQSLVINVLSQADKVHSFPLLIFFHIADLTNVTLRIGKTRADDGTMHSTLPNGALAILNRHLASDDRDIYACQQDLIDAGYEDCATFEF